MAMTGCQHMNHPLASSVASMKRPVAGTVSGRNQRMWRDPSVSIAKSPPTALMVMEAGQRVDRMKAMESLNIRQHRWAMLGARRGDEV